MLRLLSRIGIRKLFFGGSRLWTVLGGTALGLRALRRLTARTEKVVYREALLPGESLVVTSMARPRRKGR